MNDKRKYQVKCKLRQGDEVVVIAGSSKGKTGKVDKIDRKKDRVLVGGVNIRKRHTKPDAQHPDGGIVDKAMPIHVSNLALVDPKTSKPSRIGYKTEDGKKIRFAKKSGSVLSN